MITPKLSRLPQVPPVIHPVSKAAKRPVWSVMIPAYNCSVYLVEAMRSVLAQDPGEHHMQIEVVDDASTDTDVKALVEEIGRGRIAYYRQPENVGSLRNFETALNRSRGLLIHLLHGDDCVLPGYYIKMESLLKNYPQAAAAFCRNAYINQEGKTISNKRLLMDNEGIVPDFLKHLSTCNRLQPPAMVVKREVYETLGGFYGVTYGEDWEMWARIATRYAVAYTPEILANYRVHTTNITAQNLLTAKCFSDVQWVITKIAEMLPPDERKEALKKARKDYSSYIADIASVNLQRNSGKYMRMARENMKFYPSISNFGIMAYLFLRSEGSRIRRIFRF